MLNSDAMTGTKALQEQEKLNPALQFYFWALAASAYLC